MRAPRRVAPFAAAPTLAFKLRVANADPAETIHTVVLRLPDPDRGRAAAIQPRNKTSLLDLFGEPERWGQTLRNMLWTNASDRGPAFHRRTTVDLQVPCTFDFNVATTKYFHGLATEIFRCADVQRHASFTRMPTGALQVAPISWDKETRFRLPLKVWRDMMDVIIPTALGCAFAETSSKSCTHTR